MADDHDVLVARLRLLAHEVCEVSTALQPLARNAWGANILLAAERFHFVVRRYDADDGAREPTRHDAGCTCMACVEKRSAAVRPRRGRG